MASPTQEALIVVTGLPRSGTSLAMQLLQASGVPLFVSPHRAADSYNARGYFEHERVKSLAKGDSGWVSEARGHAIKVVAPLPLLLPRSESYRVLCMERPLDDVVRSQARLAGMPSAHEVTLALSRALQATREWAQGQSSVLTLNFDDVVSAPDAAMAILQEWLGHGGREASATPVVDRGLVHFGTRAS